MASQDQDRMPDLAFRLMVATMAVKDRLLPVIDKRIEGFQVQPGMTLIDYGCGPGRYTIRFARLVGDQGKVYAVDVQALALEYVKRTMREHGLNNITPVLAHGYHASIPDHSG